MKLAAYADMHDVQSGVFETESVPMMQRAGITDVLLPVQTLPFHGTFGDVTPTTAIPRFVALCQRVRDLGMNPIGWSFPAVDGDLEEARQHLSACTKSANVEPHLDMEPHGGSHWTDAELGPFFELMPNLSITTTQLEILHLVRRLACDVWLQGEMRNSFAHLEQMMQRASLHVDPSRITLVSGVFDLHDDPTDPKRLVPRTVNDIRIDLSRCQPQAMRVGRHAIWSVHTLSGPKADTLRAWRQVAELPHA